jgi:hypothetical protein
MSHARLAPLVLALAFAGPAAATTGTLSVLTYNVAGLPAAVSSSKPEANHPQISPLLNAYDLVLVQEDFAYHDLLVADVAHPHQSIKDDSPGDFGIGLGDGLNTFSQLPFDDFTRVTWSDCFGLFTNGSDCLTPKGMSFQRHELAPGVVLDVYNWHADAGNDEEDRAARRSNTRQLYDFIAAHSAGNAVLVLGDTNSRYTREGDVLPEMLAAAGLTDVWVELERGGLLPAIGSALTAGCAADPSAGDCERVDKVLYRSSEALRLEALDHEVLAALFSDAAGAPLSDHDPVYALFRYTVVPEPGTTAVLCVGLAALSRTRRLSSRSA